jgi:hypothetical protein
MSFRTVFARCIAPAVLGALSALVLGCGQEGPAGPEGPMGPPGRSRDSTEDDAGTLLGAQIQDQGTVVSGARIKARTTSTTITSADGARRTYTSFAGWYDSTRAEACAPMIAADGTTRCLPTASAQWYGGSYADSQCTQPLVWVSAQVSPNTCGAPPIPRYLFEQVSAANGCTGWRVRPLGTKLPGSSFFYKNGTQCGTLTGSPDQVAYVASGPEISASEFMQITTTTTTTP